eukprot:CAMPEP_0175082732 /NCGR_PEP_ID=MMETSP0052_2-20121109/26929_1 /TAXON_ID=51329 ORGANISM="Polytomella parva, Strain SAG 63-3" /NCGR_SAMPLE_ID=MMETSP0052_2 /ASSEMBLY_ACC=CAM_ASM_000194 /LENGTH=515 /DNA_ID=CAMNT_0016353981 /DNA_START=153 /DNA_END=1703 /DNA_ORIENTATION=+
MPNPSNMCVNCIRTQVDITEGIQKQVIMLWCKECGRYLQPPKHWVAAQLESKELLTLCIKKVKGLNKVKLVDASFIWTEPHSKRIKIKLTIQAEVFNGTILQQSFVVEYVVENNMCPDCNRANANPNSWIACAQVRQHVFHKRTFLYLEQLILKYGADSNCIKVNDIHEGVDFFFKTRAHALKFIDFLQSVVPLSYRHDKQLVSHDTHNNTYNYKYTFSVEIAPICKDDLVCLPAKVSASLGNLGPIVLVTRVTSQITITDPHDLRSVSLDTQVYYRHPFASLASGRNLTSYIVLDVEPINRDGSNVAWGGNSQTGGQAGRFQLAEVQVQRESDLGNDTVFFARTHLGNVLKPGDVALGYDLATAQLVGLDYEAFVAKGGTTPDVILVRKSYEEKRRKRRERGDAARTWKLKQLEMDVDESKTRQIEKEEADRERFMQELEEDPEMRQRINIYRDEAVMAEKNLLGSKKVAQDDMSDDDSDAPEVPLEELLEDLQQLGLDEKGDDEEEDEDMNME